MGDQTPPESRPQLEVDDALRILEEFSAAAQLRFDRTLAARGLGEAERAIPGDDAATWARRLVEVGESIDLRVQLLECTLQEALAFVRQGMPVATGIEQQDGALRWVLVCEVRGRRVRLRDLESARVRSLGFPAELATAVGRSGRPTVGDCGWWASARWLARPPPDPAATAMAIRIPSRR